MNRALRWTRKYKIPDAIINDRANINVLSQNDRSDSRTFNLFPLHSRYFKLESNEITNDNACSSSFIDVINFLDSHEAFHYEITVVTHSASVPRVIPMRETYEKPTAFLCFGLKLWVVFACNRRNQSKSRKKCTNRVPTVAPKKLPAYWLLIRFKILREDVTFGISVFEFSLRSP